MFNNERSPCVVGHASLDNAGAQPQQQQQQRQQAKPQALLREQKWSSSHQQQQQQQQQQATAIPRFTQMLAACQIRVW
jgi:hypothetical protein